MSRITPIRAPLAASCPRPGWNSTPRGHGKVTTEGLGAYQTSMPGVFGAIGCPAAGKQRQTRLAKKPPPRGFFFWRGPLPSKSPTLLSLRTHFIPRSAKAMTHDTEASSPKRSRMPRLLLTTVLLSSLLATDSLPRVSSRGACSNRRRDPRKRRRVAQVHGRGRRACRGLDHRSGQIFRRGPVAEI